MTQATGLFETMRVRRGRVPFLERHLRRLAAGAQQVGLPAPPGSLGADAAARAATGEPERVLKLVWDGTHIEWSERAKPRDDPMRVITVEEPHPGYPVKHVQRDPFERALAAAAAKGGDEPLLLTRRGRVAETARFAIVWLDGEVLRVPALALGILPSVGLARVLELSVGTGVEVSVGRFARSALDGRPVALVNSVRGVVPVATVDGVQVPAGQALVELAAAFWPAA